MKIRLRILFLTAIMLNALTQSAWAEFHWELETGFSVQFFHNKNPLGERTQNTIMIGDIERYNGLDGFFIGATDWNPNNPDSLVPFGFTRGHYSYFSKARHIFSFGRGGWGNSNILRFSIGYRTDNIAFHTRVNLDPLVLVNPNNLGTGQNEFGGGEPSFMTNDGRTPSWSDFLRYSFEEYYVRATAGPLTGFFGTASNRGKVLTFNNQNEMLLGGGLMVENFGINAPDRNADFVHDGLDTNNLLRSGAPSMDGIPDMPHVIYAKAHNIPYFMLALNVANLLPFPLTVQLALDPGNNSGVGANLDLDYRRMHGAFRLSAGRVFDRVNIDAIYKIAGGDPFTLTLYDEINNPDGPHQPDGAGFFVHNWGVYANILDLWRFDLGLGYSGYLKVHEDFLHKDTGVIRTRTSPLFTGLDLRIRYTGARNLVITSFNNISFAESNKSSIDHYVIGVVGQQLPYPNVSQSWFALYNALTVHYDISSRLTLALQAASRFGRITNTGFLLHNTFYPDAEIVRTRHTVGGGGFVSYRIFPNRMFETAEIQLGFVFRYLMQSYTNSISGSDEFFGSRDARGGAFDFAIPIRLHIVFGNR